MTTAVSAEAAPPRAVPFDIQEPSMARALAELAREAGIELLFDQRLVQTLKAKPVRGRLSVDAALTALLNGTHVGFRLTPDGAYVLFAIPASRPPADGEVGAIAEILVVGRRTQNADIRRTENDIQPYKVASAEDIETAHSDNIDDYLRSREPSDVQIRAPVQDPTQFGSTRSAVDLRGFGSQQTLVLIDGRRMPSVPSTQGEFNQSDLNGIPLGAIDRIEALTSTAGGVYGPSAVGGVINVVLKREYRGADLNVTSGVTDRGDAGQTRIEARVGFTPDHGDTDIMLFGAYSVSEPLLAGQRGLTERAARQAFRNDPTDFLSMQPYGDAVNVVSSGGPLTLSPQFGGAALGSTFTFLPLNFTGTPAQAAAILAANAGKIDLSLTNDRSGTQRYLTAGPAVTSGIFSARRRLGDRLELFVDGLYESNGGKAVGAGDDSVNVVPNVVDNPFEQPVTLNFPDAVFGDVVRTRTQTSRFTAGMIATLARDWKADLDYAIGQSNVDVLDVGRASSAFAFTAAIMNGTAGPGGLPVLNPLGNWPAFLAASSAYAEPQSIRFSLVNRFDDASLRLAGPVVSLPGGPLTVTMLAEHRRERIPTSVASFDVLGAPPFSLVLPLRTKAVNSAYGELRAPLTPADAGFVPLRGLEVQLAGRYDQTATVLPDNGAPGAPSNNRLIAITNRAAVFTVGARVLPTPMLMLRASLATGQLPPTVTQLQSSSTAVTAGENHVADPLRGGQPIGIDGAYTLLQAGSHAVKPEQARTVTLGAVLNPWGHGPRLSVDYSRTTTTREIRAFPLTAQQISQLLAAPAMFPGRVRRGPLTPADAALGYTAGPVLVVDLGDINAGGAVVDALDAKLDWTLPAGRAGDFRLYGSGTWEPRYLEEAALGQPAFDRIGFADGPLALRGNAGVEWTRGPLGIDLNAQYFGSYRITNSNPATALFSNATLLRLQGAASIPSQVYLDLALKRRFQVRGATGSLKVVDARVGVHNLLGQQPPIDATPAGIGYSPYGDPRGRRVELALTASF